MSETKKPRLCEVLGVEVGERFKAMLPIPGDGNTIEWYINKDGYVTSDIPEGHGFMSGYNLCAIINDPERLVRKQRLTEPELAICKAVGAKWVSMDNFQKTCLVDLWEHRPDVGAYSKEYVPSGEDECELGSIYRDRFPSVHPGDCIEVGTD